MLGMPESVQTVKEIVGRCMVIERGSSLGEMLLIMRLKCDGAKQFGIIH